VAPVLEHVRDLLLRDAVHRGDLRRFHRDQRAPSGDKLVLAINAYRPRPPPPAHRSRRGRTRRLPRLRHPLRPRHRRRQPAHAGHQHTPTARRLRRRLGPDLRGPCRLARRSASDRTRPHDRHLDPRPMGRIPRRRHQRMEHHRRRHRRLGQRLNNSGPEPSSIRRRSGPSSHRPRRCAKRRCRSAAAASGSSGCGSEPAIGQVPTGRHEPVQTGLGEVLVGNQREPEPDVDLFRSGDVERDVVKVGPAPVSGRAICPRGCVRRP
jgi:hypothetical protein